MPPLSAGDSGITSSLSRAFKSTFQKSLLQEECNAFNSAFAVRRSTTYCHSYRAFQPLANSLFKIHAASRGDDAGLTGGGPPDTCLKPIMSVTSQGCEIEIAQNVEDADAFGCGRRAIEKCSGCEKHYVICTPNLAISAIKSSAIGVSGSI